MDLITYRTTESAGQIPAQLIRRVYPLALSQQLHNNRSDPSECSKTILNDAHRGSTRRRTEETAPESYKTGVPPLALSHQLHMNRSDPFECSKTILNTLHFVIQSCKSGDTPPARALYTSPSRAVSRVLPRQHTTLRGPDHLPDYRERGSNPSTAIRRGFPR